MAQYWVDCDDLAKVTVNDRPNGSLEMSVVTDDGSPSFLLNGAARAVISPVDMVASAQADVRVLVRDASGNSARGLGAGVQFGEDQFGRPDGQGHLIARGSTDARFYINTSNISISGAPSITNNAYHWTGAEYELSGSDQIVRLYKWTGDASDRPSAFDTLTNPSGLATGTQKHGVGAYLFDSANSFYVKIIAIGTDGDPAPTGPVGGISAEPFALRHNPRTNKVIPVLSSPTVTDIGATCVRPRVSKGF